MKHLLFILTSISFMSHAAPSFIKKHNLVFTEGAIWAIVVLFSPCESNKLFFKYRNNFKDCIKDHGLLHCLDGHLTFYTGAATVFSGMGYSGYYLAKKAYDFSSEIHLREKIQTTINYLSAQLLSKDHTPS